MLRTKITADAFITFLVVAISVPLWCYNIYAVNIAPPGTWLVSQNIGWTIAHWPVAGIMPCILLACWSDFRTWMRRHYWGSVYLWGVLIHLTWTYRVPPL